MVTKEQRLIKQLAGRVQTKTPIATDMFIPNHSGNHDAGRILSTPTKDTSIVNKKYVDDNTIINSTASRVRAKTAVAQVINSGYPTITFGTEDFDNLGEWNGTTFTPKESGYYQVSWNLLLINAHSIGWVFTSAIYKNNVLFANGFRNQVDAAHTGYLDSNGNTIIYLDADAGDYIDIHAFYSNTGNLHTDDHYNHLSIHRLS